MIRIHSNLIKKFYFQEKKIEKDSKNLEKYCPAQTWESNVFVRGKNCFTFSIYLRDRERNTGRESEKEIQRHILTERERERKSKKKILSESIYK